MPNIRYQEFAIIFADIVDSTRMYESLGDSRAKQLITELENDISRVVKETGGHVVEVIGDEVMSCYDSPDAAAAGACRIQECVDAYSERCGMPVSARLGLHYGPAIVEEGRMYGDSVNVAARMASIAQARQIITTEQVVQNLSDEHRRLVRRFDKVKIKGKQQRMVIYDLLWRMDVTFMHTSPVTQNQLAKTLVLTYAGKIHRMPPTQGSMRIGRDPCNELVVSTTAASRTHAILEFSRGKYVLSDISTNGTYVTTQNQQSLYLRRETIPLLGSGKIGLGEPVSTDNRHVISYDLQESGP
ncbi:MAG: FHA domain-containing protein [Candidatus Thiodiazotropha sp. (ex Dulcina madagascariensis)]|nr:FHA domain-containing protein [Candidatus Thiodiazotropha sp. (ex Dulcina madagascariensis)]MCU7928039.1 FHA domain-containing protein [Candidatus Thiodiazotropha sp. (ex Dulcina madagascariensis)]